MPVRTHAVASRIIGDARSALEEAAGQNQIISKTEAKKLPADLQKAVDKARQESPRVTVESAVDAYARQVSRTLAAVDKRGKGVLSEAEAKRILDPALRRKALDVRAELLSGGAAPVDPPSSGTSSRPTSAQVVAALGADPMPAWHESGDSGVNTDVVALAGKTSLAAAMTSLTQSPAMPWYAESNLVLSPFKGAKAIEAFQADARSALESWETPSGGPLEISSFLNSVEATFGKLSSVRYMTGTELNGGYLVGKAKDCYVAVICQRYSDG